MTTYPEHEKLHAIADLSQAIGEFLDWAELQGWQLMTIANIDCGKCGGDGSLYVDPDEPCPRCEGKGFVKSDYHYTHAPGSVNQKLAQHFGIDLDKIEEEKRAMLDHLRGANK